jgi:hypothetical protein
VDLADFKNDFTWSFSRHGVFNACHRKYWLNHYAFWNGWRSDCDPRTRELYIQKNLTTRPMWLGSKVHDAAEYALKTFQESRFVGPDELVSKTLQKAEREVEASKHERYRNNPKHNPGFQEHYYGADQSPQSFSEVYVEIERQVRTLYENPIFKRILQVPERIRQIEVLNKTELAGVPVWVKLDVLMEDGHGGLVIVDWKTGRSHGDEKVNDQLGVYGLYARRDLGVQQIKAVHVDLRGNQFSTYQVDEAQLERSEAFVRESAETMLAKLTEPAENQGQEADFDMLPEGSSACSRCRFRRDCGRE